MSKLIDIAEKVQRYSVVKYSKNTLYGLRNNIRLSDLLYKQMVLRALEYDYSFSVLSEKERGVLMSEISLPLNGSSRCLTC
jgi:hypothetical protein